MLWAVVLRSPPGRLQIPSSLGLAIAKAESALSIVPRQNDFNNTGYVHDMFFLPPSEAFVALLVFAVCVGWVYFETRPGPSLAPQSPPKHILTCGTCSTKFPLYRPIEIRVPPLSNVSYICTADPASCRQHHLVYWDPPGDDDGPGCWELVCGACQQCTVLPSHLQGPYPPDLPNIRAFRCFAGVPPFHRFG